VIGYIIRRVLNYLILTAVASCLAYILASETLNPALKFASKHPRPSQAVIDHYLDGMGLDPRKSILSRTLSWFGHIFKGDLGIGANNESITHELWSRMGVSLELLLIGSVIGIVLGVALGVWGAVKQYSFSDQTVGVLSYIIFAMPTFVMGILAMTAATELNRLIGHNLINFAGEYSASVNGGFWPHFEDRLSHLILPTIVLVLGSAASFSRYQRSTMLDVLGADYIRTARAKGRTRGSALLRHGVRVALIPMSTFFAYSFGLLVTGATYLEIVFGWHGMGELAITSILNNDVNAVAGSTLYVSVLILCSSLLSEVLYAALDPRARR